METTENLELPYIMPSQAQKHVTHNEAVRMLDALTQIAVLDRALAAPPLSPAAGDRYALPTGCTGAWAGKDGTIAAWQDGGWRHYAPRPGFVLWDEAEAELVVFDGSAWIPAAIASADLQTLPLLGINATADATNRLRVAAPATLLSHDGNDHRLIVDKAAAGDTASLLFQDGHSGRAEIGLTGDDHLHVKVSADGATFTEAIVIDGATGAASLPATPCGMVNLLINGNFAINQRGFAGGALAAATFGHDRIKAGAGGASYTVSGETVSHASGELCQVVEAPGIAGAVVTLSVEDLTGGSLSISVAGQSGTITAGSGRRKATVTIPGGSTGNITVTWQPTAGAVTYRRIQLNLGGLALPFERRHPATEMALCQRYFQTSPGTSLGSCVSFFGNVTSGVTYYARLAFAVAMRTTPTLSLIHQGTNGSSFAGSAGTAYQASSQGFTEYRTAIASVNGGGFWSRYEASAEL